MYVALPRSDVNASVANLHNGPAKLHLWFSQNDLVIHADKSEALLFETAQQTSIAHGPLEEVFVAGCSVPLSDSVKIWRNPLTFNKHM